ncbi:exodeoxyribonuclease V subunit beta [Phocaeicola sp.]|uniref:UvrD-helicase domain-containing protein n=1 Tax=Phocaeicola sp. TaxID=2773926 RepID=UPI0023D556CC|nr:UvrD-helicase domain-containing protein [Phocaeicola sp.]MDE5677533.1 UvrD-helicase domain-containing protein [Phocaeicola sp.]
MKHSPELLVYKASAGSGKTFTLAVEYIKLLIQNPRAYRNILAVTFTNKATTEMKERILSQLYGIWIKDKESDPYLQKITEELQMPQEDIRTAAGTALHYMIHDYSRFRVETIDSFFQSVMRNLARELELGANLDIELNNMEVLSEAVDSMIEKLDRNSPVLYWLLEYIEERIADDKRWNVSGEIKSFGRNIFDEGYIEKGNGLREKLQDKDCIKNYRKTLLDILEEVLEQMKGFADQFFGILETNGIKAEDLKNGNRGIASYFNKLQAGKLDDSIRNATVEKCMDNPDEWVKKNSPLRHAITELAETELIPLLNDSERFRSRNNRLANSCQLSLRHVNNVRLLANIDEEVRELNHENNRFLLSDTNALLHQLVKDGDSSFVFEKIGTTIRNVMIDEFQDTSRMQWDNFRLLLLEGLSQGADSLIVGDVKQSIYRWRNGDWGILNGLKTHIGAFPVKVKTLSTNRRSAAHIIQFNNEVFTAACNVLNNIYKEEQGEECKELKEAYNDVCQQICKDPGKGYVRVEFLSDKEDRSYADDTLYRLGEEVDSLVAQGIHLQDIAILVRKNKSIPLIADYFDKNTPYKIVSDEAFRLDASLAVCMIVDGIRYLSQPDNRIAKAQLAAAYQNEVLHKEININTLLLNDINNYLPYGFTEETEKLRLMPLYELMEKLFDLFQMTHIEQQDAYLCAFFDAVTEYLQNNSSELSAFITYWEEKLCSKTIPSGEVEGIRILSIHKSKGLEYHTVLLPFCDWKMENETNNHLVWCAPCQEPFNQLDIVPVNYSTAMQQSIYQNDFLNERLQLWVDNLNLLYVAFTRAQKNLIIWGKAGQKKTVSELLGNALSVLTGKDYTAGEESYELGTLYLSTHEGNKPASRNKLLTVPRRLPVHLETLKTHIEFKQSNRSAQFIRGEEESEEKYIRKGQLLHHLFSVIRTTDDVSTAIERLRFEGIIESAQQEKQLRKLTEWALGHPLVKEWYSGHWELYNECAIIYQQQGVLQTRRPDRVMMKNGEVVVVDFKFGKKRTAYNKQVKEYMNLLADMGHQHIRGYLWYVFNNELEEIK